LDKIRLGAFSGLPKGPEGTFKLSTREELNPLGKRGILEKEAFWRGLKARDWLYWGAPHLFSRKGFKRGPPFQKGTYFGG